MGASSMFVFSLGTLPIMIGFAYLFSKFHNFLNNKLYKYTGILIILLGFLMIIPNLSFI